VVLGLKIEFREPEAIGWKMAWLVLGSERCEPLLPMAGVPPGICARPVPLRETVQQAWKAHDAGLPGVPPRDDPAFHEAYERAFRSLLTSVFAKLTDQYGEAEATVLYSWTRRHFVDRKQVNWWGQWQGLYQQLSSFHEWTKVPQPFAEDRRKWIRSLVDSRLGPEVLRRDEARIRAALAHDKSAFEQQALRLELGGEVDLETVTDLALSRERAYELWIEFARQLRPDEERQLVDWAMQEARALGYPTLVPPLKLD
jgi:hypothetical protein